MTDPTQTWPAELVARYRDKGYWRGETFPAMLRAHAEAHPDRVAITSGEVQITYAALNDRARALGAGLLALGLRPRDRVLIQMGNAPCFFEAVFAAFAAGLVPVYALPAHRRTEVAHLAGKAGARAILVQDRIERFDHAAMMLDLKRDLPAL